MRARAGGAVLSPRGLRVRAALAATLALALALLAWEAHSPALASPPASRAHTARLLRVTDAASLRYNQSRSEGSNLFEEGAVGGSLPGTMHVYANIGSIFTASFTIFTHSGNVVGRARALLHGHGTYESFGGSLVATAGSGSYKHARGHGGFYGVLNRRTYAMTVQTTGALTY